MALLLFLRSTSAAANEPALDFGLTGRVTITKATLWMDGGSVSVDLKDEHGQTALAGYRSAFRRGGGGFIFKGSAISAEIRRDTPNAVALLKFIQAACVATYETDDPKQLDASKDWNQFAMAEFLRKLTPHPKVNPPTR